MSERDKSAFDVRQEPDALASRKLMTVTIVSVITMAVALVTAALLLERWAGQERRLSASSGPLEQSLIIDTRRGLDLKRDQKASLARWGWVDRDAGIARIPIERAIDLVVERPIPVDRPLSPAAPSSTVGAPERPPTPFEVAP